MNWNWLVIWFAAFTWFALTYGSNSVMAQRKGIGPESSPPWPQFRGPNGDGVAPECDNLPVHFGEDRNVVWQVDVPGTGWSSPISDSERLWMTSATNSDEGGLELTLLGFEKKRGRYSSRYRYSNYPNLI